MAARFRLRSREEYRRILRSVDDTYSYVVEEDYDSAYAAAFDEAEGADHPLPEIRPFTLEDAIRESRAFYSTFAIVVYDPPSDAFLAFRDATHTLEPSNKKLLRTLRMSLRLLRKEFPDRFTPQSPELAFAMASGDYPHVKRWKLPYTEGAAPVLMFGSAFAEERFYPNMIPMPMPHPMHLDCFVEWAEKGRVCGRMREKEHGYGQERGWDNLTPQVIWRGTDFGYLPTLQQHPSLAHPHQLRIFPASTMREGGGVARSDAVRALSEQYDALLPRWKGVALTAQAELDAESAVDEAPPWADMKFTSCIDGGKKSPARGLRKYAVWESVGIAVGDGLWDFLLARYRYHIDLAGGGGTTWTGTLDKLGMPGLLFHHVTPMKDYIHDRMRPWRHYVPVGSDLRDLRSKFEWAEGHPAEARRIAEEGAELVRKLRAPEGYGRMYREDFVEPMRRVVEAYRPVSYAHPEAGSWREVLTSMHDVRLVPVVKCSGRSAARGSCKAL